MSQFIEMAENISSRLSENSSSRVGPVEPVTLNIGGPHNSISPAARPLNQLQVQLSRQTVGAVGQEMVQQSARLRIRNFTRSVVSFRLEIVYQETRHANLDLRRNFNISISDFGNGDSEFSSC